MKSTSSTFDTSQQGDRREEKEGGPVEPSKGQVPSLSTLLSAIDKRGLVEWC